MFIHFLNRSADLIRLLVQRVKHLLTICTFIWVIWVQMVKHLLNKFKRLIGLLSCLFNKCVLTYVLKV